MKTKQANTQTKTRHINGVRAYLVAGSWYADYNQYQQTKRQQGINANIEAFCLFCDRFNLQPTG